MKEWSSKIMQGKSLNGYPFRIETNVNAKVVGPNHELKQNIDKHNMATANLTEGVVKFLRGEFTESFISGLLPNIGNDFNIADQYIPAYMGIGVAGVTYDPENQNNLILINDSGSAPSYADTSLVSEILPLANPCRATVSKSVRSNTNLSQASSLIISAAYHFDRPAQSQTFILEPSTKVYHKDDKFYLSSSRYPGEHILQRIKSLSPASDGWYFEQTTDLDEHAGTRQTGMLYYKEQQESRSNGLLETTKEVLSIDFTTGIMTLVADSFVFSSGLKIAYDPINFDFKYANGSSATVPFVTKKLQRMYCISELGLFSGDYNNDKSKLLARVVLDEETPMKITEGDYVLITWQIGVYALDDALYVEDFETSDSGVSESSTLKYLVQEEQTDLVWSEITEVDSDGKPVEEESVVATAACYKVLAVDFLDFEKDTDTNESTQLVKITLDSAHGLYKGFNASFSCLSGNILGTILDIESKVTTESGQPEHLYDIITLDVSNSEVYTENPFWYYSDQVLLSHTISCNQVLTSVIENIPSYRFNYKVEDVTNEYLNERPEGQESYMSVGVLTNYADNTDLCTFNPLYYAFGTDLSVATDIPNSVLDTEYIYYTFPSITECSWAGLTNMHYYYKVSQIPDDTKPILFDDTYFIVHVVLTHDRKTNARGITHYISKYRPEYDTPTVADSILFTNRYNPTIVEGDK